MELTKRKITKRIEELNKITPPKYTAMELHGKRPLMARAQRREMAKYYQEVREQKTELGKKLKEVKDYLGKINGKGKIGTFSKKSEVIIQPIPQLKKTRLGRYQRVGRY